MKKIFIVLAIIISLLLVLIGVNMKYKGSNNIIEKKEVMTCSKTTKQNTVDTNTNMIYEYVNNKFSKLYWRYDFDLSGKDADVIKQMKDTDLCSSFKKQFEIANNELKIVDCKAWNNNNKFFVQIEIDNNSISDSDLKVYNDKEANKSSNEGRGLTCTIK